MNRWPFHLGHRKEMAVEDLDALLAKRKEDRRKEGTTARDGMVGSVKNRGTTPSRDTSGYIGIPKRE